MGRPLGKRNPDFAATRQALIERLLVRLAKPDGARLSFREMAVAALVSTATLRHYFGSRAGVLQAVLSFFHLQGLPHLHRVATETLVGLGESTTRLVEALLIGLSLGVGAIHELGLSTGMRDPVIGPAYLAEILEPTLQSVEVRLQRHMALGHMRICDARVAALALVSPLLMAVLHQRSLGGDRCRALDVDAFAAEHVDGFLRAYQAGRAVP